MPYFLNTPCSWAITSGEQSVSALMPNLRSATSGASLAGIAPPRSGGTLGELLLSPQPLRARDDSPAAAAPINIRRLTCDPERRRDMVNLKCGVGLASDAKPD